MANVRWDGTKLEKARKEAGLTTDELAKKLGFSFGLPVVLMEQNKTDPDTGMLCKLADTLGLTTDYFLDRCTYEQSKKTAEFLAAV